MSTGFALLGRKLIVNASAYGIFRIINQAGALVMLPLYLAYLTPLEFGVIALAGVIASVVQPIANLGLHASVERFYHDYDEKLRWPAITRVWLLSVVAALSLVVGLDWVLMNWYERLFLNGSYQPYIRLAVFSVLCLSFQYVPLVILRVTEQIRQYGLILTASFLSLCAIHLVLILGLGMGLEGYFVGQLLNSVIWGGYWLAWMARRVQRSAGVSVAAEIRYALYLLPVAVVDSVNRVADKFLLEKFVGLESLGLYGVADKFGGYFFQVNSALKTAFFPIIYRLMGEAPDQCGSMLTRVSMIYYMILSFVAVLFALLGEAFVLLFAGSEYHGAIDYIPFFVLIYFLRSQETVWGRGADLVKRSDIYMYVALPVLAAIIIVTYFAVAAYGVAGALAALLGTVAVRMAVMVYVGHRLFQRKFPALFVAGTGTYCMLAYAIVASLDFGGPLLDLVGRVLLVTVLLGVFLVAYLKRQAAVERVTY